MDLGSSQTRVETLDTFFEPCCLGQVPYPFSASRRVARIRGGACREKTHGLQQSDAASARRQHIPEMVTALVARS